MLLSQAALITIFHIFPSSKPAYIFPQTSLCIQTISFLKLLTTHLMKWPTQLSPPTSSTTDSTKTCAMCPYWSTQFLPSSICWGEWVPTYVLQHHCSREKGVKYAPKKAIGEKKRWVMEVARLAVWTAALLWWSAVHKSGALVSEEDAGLQEIDNQERCGGEGNELIWQWFSGGEWSWRIWC